VDCVGMSVLAALCEEPRECRRVLASPPAALQSRESRREVRLSIVAYFWINATRVAHDCARPSTAGPNRW